MIALIKTAVLCPSRTAFKDKRPILCYIYPDVLINLCIHSITELHVHILTFCPYARYVATPFFWSWDQVDPHGFFFKVPRDQTNS